jgi:hypothetical protein
MIAFVLSAIVVVAAIAAVVVVAFVIVVVADYYYPSIQDNHVARQCLCLIFSHSFNSS